MSGLFFDQPYYIEINEARWSSAKKVIADLPGVETCLDAGCGPGWFSVRLAELGLKVLGVDGRQELVDEAARRVPQARFELLDITSPEGAAKRAPCDLTFCFGLLYHLENPFAAVRNLSILTGKYLFIETQVAPGDGNDCILVSEGRNETQGLNFHALIPSRKVLLKMLYVSGFTNVYRFTGSIGHGDFIDTPDRLHRREVFLATKGTSVSLPDFVYEAEPTTPKIDYSR